MRSLLILLGFKRESTFTIPSIIPLSTCMCVGTHVELKELWLCPIMVKSSISSPSQRSSDV